MLALREISGRKQTDLCAELELSWDVVNAGCRRAALRLAQGGDDVRRFRALVADGGGPADAEVPEVVRRPDKRGRPASLEARECAVGLVLRSGRPVAHVAREIRVPPTTLHYWLRTAAERC